MKTSKISGSTGRPRGFDVDEALEKAIKVFWRKGYEGASLSDLTEAMGINRPSLYAAFGNKEQLFRKAMDRYSCSVASGLPEAIREPTARGVVQKILLDSVTVLTGEECPNGCLSVVGALACSEEAQPIREDLSARRAQFEKDLQIRFERAIAEGDLPTTSDAAALAGYVATLHQGLSVQVAGGKSRENLLKIVELTLSSWPPPG